MCVDTLKTNFIELSTVFVCLFIYLIYFNVFDTAQNL